MRDQAPPGAAPPSHVLTTVLAELRVFVIEGVAAGAANLDDFGRLWGACRDGFERLHLFKRVIDHPALGAVERFEIFARLLRVELHAGAGYTRTPDIRNAASNINSIPPNPRSASDFPNSGPTLKSPK